MWEFFKNLLKRKKEVEEIWEIIDAKTAAFTVSHGRLGGMQQNFIFYRIEYCGLYETYRLVCEGENAQKHVVYGEMLKRLAAFNRGETIDFNENTSTVTKSNTEVVIVSIPIKNEAEDVFKFVRKDPILLGSINFFKRGFELGGGEVFKQEENILATNKGYYASFYAKDVDLGEPDSEQKNEEDEE